jgi:hypothetical protein
VRRWYLSTVRPGSAVLTTLEVLSLLLRYIRADHAGHARVQSRAEPKSTEFVLRDSGSSDPVPACVYGATVWDTVPVRLPVNDVRDLENACVRARVR